MQARSFLVARQGKGHLLGYDRLVLVLTLAAITQTDEGIHLTGFILMGFGTNHEESAGHVDVSDQAVVSVNGGANGRVDNVGILKIVPELLSSVLRKSMALVNQKAIPVLVLSHVLIQVVGELLSVQLNVSAIIDINQILSRSQTIPETREPQVDRLVIGIAILSEAISQTDQGVDIEGGGLVLPGSDSEEGAHDVAVDCQELVSISALHCSHIQQTGLGKVVPIFLTEGVIHELVNIISVPFSLGRELVPAEGRAEGVGRLAVLCLLGRRVGKDECQQGEEEDSLRSHRLFISLIFGGAHKESADHQFADLDTERGRKDLGRGKGPWGSGFYPQRKDFGTR